jgi:DNA-binding MarR family transcriptional regulator
MADDEDVPFGWRQRPDRRTSLLFDVFVLGQRTKALVEAAMRDTGLRPDEYAAYSVLFELGPITLTALARELGMPVTTVADFVRAMERRGHLRKAAHHSDGRARALSLTASGLTAHRRASRSFERAHVAMSSSLDLPEEEARAVVQRLARSAEAASRTVAESTRSVRSQT